MHLKSPSELQFPAQVLFVVPKRNFKKAHDRNLIRRRMREIYRLNKPMLYAGLGPHQVLLAFVYFSKKTETFESLKKSMLDLMKSLPEGKKD